MPIFEIAALAAAVTWAFTGVLAANPSRALGAPAFNRWRMSVVFIMLLAWTLASGTLTTLPQSALPALILSGLIGIFVGDTALFLTMNRLGPRRTAILFSMNAPISVILGWLLLGEDLPLKAVIGILLALSGVVLAIVYGKRKDQLHQWESITGHLGVGVALGLLAALSQATGALIARPVMDAGGVDPIAGSAVRVGAAAFCLLLMAFAPFSFVRQKTKMTREIFVPMAASGILGMGVGMTLILFALSGAKTGIITTLSATTPVMMLPLLWWRTKEAPAIGAWVGALLVICGTALIFTR